MLCYRRFWFSVLLFPLPLTAQTLIGTYTVDYRLNAAGCPPGDGNPYFCPSPIPPGPIFINNPNPGRYYVKTVANTGGFGERIWVGNATAGTQYAVPQTIGDTLYFDVASGQNIVLYAWDWFVYDNPDFTTTVELYAVSCQVPSGEQFQVPTSGSASDNPLLSGWFFSVDPPGDPGPWHGYRFVEKLLGGNFSGITVKEFDVPGGSSDCDTLGSTLSYQLSGSSWTVTPDNLFDDNLGYADRVIRDVQAVLNATGRSSCSVKSFQQMKMFCSSTNDFLPYGPVNLLQETIYTDHVSFSRGGVGASIRFR
jgi:hypothetical protein